jgi:hypothetical protein
MAKQRIDKGDIAKGAAAVTVAAGVVAAGMLLSDKKNRQKLAKFTDKTIKNAKKIAKDITTEAEKGYDVAQMNLPQVKVLPPKKFAKKPAKSKKTKS